MTGCRRQGTTKKQGPTRRRRRINARTNLSPSSTVFKVYSGPPVHSQNLCLGKLMRLVGSCFVGLALAFPAPAAAQTVKRADIAGTWAGNAYYDSTDSRGCSVRRGCGTADGYMALWPTSGLWWYEHHMPDWGMHGGARWRLVGDTLWLGIDWLYGDILDDSLAANFLVVERGVDQRGVDALDLVPGVADTVDTLNLAWYPRDDSLFWSRNLRRRNLRYVTAYKVSLTDDRLTLVRLDSLLDSLGVRFMMKRALYRRVKSPIRIVKSWPSLPPGWP